jgi:hypothetical protein
MSVAMGGLNSLNTGNEGRTHPTPVVVDVPIGVIAVRVVGSPAKRVAEEDVAKPCCPQHLLERISGELRAPPRVWRRADVPDVLDAIAVQQPDELINVAQPIADGQDRRLARRVHGTTLQRYPDRTKRSFHPLRRAVAKGGPRWGSTRWIRLHWSEPRPPQRPDLAEERADRPLRAWALRESGGAKIRALFAPSNRLDPCIQAWSAGARRSLFRGEDSHTRSTPQRGSPQGAGGGNLIAATASGGRRLGGGVARARAPIAQYSTLLTLRASRSHYSSHSRGVEHSLFRVEDRTSCRATPGPRQPLGADDRAGPVARAGARAPRARPGRGSQGRTMATGLPEAAGRTSSSRPEPRAARGSVTLKASVSISWSPVRRVGSRQTDPRSSNESHGARQGEPGV